MNRQRLVWSVACFCLTCALAFAQTGLTGKWQTDPSGSPESQRIVMELSIDGDKLSGTVQENGAKKPLTIMEGRLGDKAFSFKTTPPPGPDFTSTVTWNGRILDDNTISVTRSTETDYKAVARSGGGFRGGVPVDPPPPRPQNGPTLTLHRAK